MPREKPAENRGISSEPLQEISGYCPNCRSVAFFTVDKELGYFKQCPRCGHAEHLQRRRLSFDRQFRQWR